MKKIVLLLLVGACADKLPEGSRLERTRALALAARPAGGEGRAWPRPGEETALDWLIAGPASLPPMAYRIAICAAGDAGCSAPPFLVADGAGMPDVGFVAPDVDLLLIAASIAPDGEPGTDVVLELPVEHATANHHPSLGPLSFAGRPWGDACEPIGAGGPAVELRAGTFADDRERYIAADGTPARESLRLSFFATAGKLDGQYRVIEADDPADAPDAVDLWTPPSADEVPDGGLEAHVIVVVRDLRGGVSWTERTLCVTNERTNP